MRLGRWRAPAAGLIALAIGSGGCAVMMKEAPKADRAPREMPACSSARGGVALDAVVAALLGAGALVGFAGEEPGVGLVLGGIAGLYTWSAVSGHRSATACEEARREYQEEMTVVASAPPEPAAERPATAPGAGPAAAAGPPRPVGPPLEAAAGEEDEPPAGEPAAEEPAIEEPAAEEAPAAPGDWSDFWVEVPR